MIQTDSDKQCRGVSFRVRCSGDLHRPQAGEDLQVEGCEDYERNENADCKSEWCWVEADSVGLLVTWWRAGSTWCTEGPVSTLSVPRGSDPGSDWAPWWSKSPAPPTPAGGGCWAAGWRWGPAGCRGVSLAGRRRRKSLSFCRPMVWILHFPVTRGKLILPADSKIPLQRDGENEIWLKGEQNILHGEPDIRRHVEKELVA